MTNPTPLSPAAQAVLDAYEKSNDCYREEWGQLAAALRAAADQLMPSQQDYDEASHEFAVACLNGMAYVANELKSIAAELDPSLKTDDN